MLEGEAGATLPTLESLGGGFGMEFKLNDGGRDAAGYKGHAGDCFCRAVAIASRIPYADLYDVINGFGKSERRGKYKKHKSHARTGVYMRTAKKIMEALGFKWVPTMAIGSGCKVHMRAGELPAGRLVVRVSRHFSAVIDGVINDTYDPSRGGTRCVYGYWIWED